ncbi:NAD+ synthase [Halodesulfovibrio marinisediminis]|uniref:Glutamine-dependent NAD(+) synthetase n=1 Tax=Halodesulfovibrio marinisediminis DSM 17456 TaxID=1121457 RepID=A0A1N6E4B6_9BACT|nr:NAD+ synthase [Halodesulfovibrio marinisediminis]SIN77880.1 NAD+ synthase (glutamine-hydrolysing) [Halodesulfovibrio marinisediminis DSM 17456]
MKIALLQLNPVVGDVSGNIVKIVEAVKKAAKDGAQLCVTSELSVCGYPPRDLLLRQDFIDGCQASLKTLAFELKDMPPTLVGVPIHNPDSVGKPVFNAAALVANGTYSIVAHKTLLPTYDVFDENRYFEQGKKLGLVNIHGRKIGVTICEDIWNDKSYWKDRRKYKQNPLGALAEDGAEIIVNLSASPFTLGKQFIREQMLSSMVHHYELPFLYANQVGGNDDLIFAGKSLAYAADGTLIGRGKSFEEDILVVDLESNSGRVEQEDATDEAQAWNALVLGTRDYVRKCGFKKVVLGLSGGVDSALTAAVAVEALGPENVIGVLMPSPYSSQGSIDDSFELAKRLGIRTEKIEIEPMLTAFLGSLKPIFEGANTDVTEENLQARIRGNLLMAISNKFGALLLTTGNKSELAVGYCTIYGDMAGGLAVIADVPKTLVWKVCRWANDHCGEKIPVEIIEKAPSAELRPDQKDSDSLPEYEELDAILHKYIVERLSKETIILQGYAEEDVERVLWLVKISEFKRRQAAPGLRITDRAFGTGWRMPVASRVHLL